jgi:hypothetical protein
MIRGMFASVVGDSHARPRFHGNASASVTVAQLSAQEMLNVHVHKLLGVTE